MKCKENEFAESRFVSRREVILGGKTISYTVICEDNVLTADDGHHTGTIFSYSYMRDDVQNTSVRPVIFVYNGGPGSSSIWLHAGFFAPRRVSLSDPLNPPVSGPAHIEDNPHCLIDCCDIVFVDPVGTGYGRLLDESASSEYFGVEQDALATSLFIENWLKRYRRFESPKFLIGESYGTVRSCYTANELMGGPTSSRRMAVGIPVDGIIMMGSAVGVKFPEPDRWDMTGMLIPSMAATNWYHNPDGKPALEEFVDGAWRFMSEDYLKSLFIGNNMCESDRNEFEIKLSGYTGLSVDFLRQHDYLIDSESFVREILRMRGLEVGSYDSRFTLPHSGSIGLKDPVGDDGAMGKYTPAFVTGLHQMLENELGINFDRQYYPIEFNVNSRWDWQTSRSAVEALEACLRRNSRMKVMFVTGYYDLVTVLAKVRHVVSHLHCGCDRITVKEYESGHMPYLGEKSASVLSEDIRRFIC